MACPVAVCVAGSVVFWAVVTTILFDLQVKLEPRSPAKPSRVVHIRNIPNDVTEAEIVHLGIPFGRVTNVLVLKGKNQVNYRRSLSVPRFPGSLLRPLI